MIREAIQSAMADAGLDPAALAAASRVPHATVRAWIAGDRDTSAARIDAMLAALDLAIVPRRIAVDLSLRHAGVVTGDPPD